MKKSIRCIRVTVSPLVLSVAPCFGLIRQHFALKRHLLCASLYRKQLGERFAAWHRFTELTR
jgi:hypothetical protein